MGGVGKTQIAAHYAHRSWKGREVDVLMWVNAASRDSIVAALAQAGSSLCGADAADSDAAARAFLDWLDDPDVPRWLIVLDDLTNPVDLNGLWPPATERGRTIVTTRRRDAALAAHTRTRIDVDLYTPDQAVDYLTERLGGEDRLLEDAAGLARDLGYLPLALAQAAAYILDQPGSTCATYKILVSKQIMHRAYISVRKSAFPVRQLFGYGRMMDSRRAMAGGMHLPAPPAIRISDARPDRQPVDHPQAHPVLPRDLSLRGTSADVAGGRFEAFGGSRSPPALGMVRTLHLHGPGGSPHRD
jgi:hypothetical protein